MIRIAEIEDCSRLEVINVFAWCCAYSDFIPLDVLYNKFTIKSRENRFIEKNILYK